MNKLEERPATVQEAEAVLCAEKEAEAALCASLEAVKAKLEESVDLRWRILEIRVGFRNKLLGVETSDRDVDIKARLVKKINHEINIATHIISLREADEIKMSAEVVRLEEAHQVALQRIDAAEKAVEAAMLAEARAALAHAEQMARGAIQDDLQSLHDAAEGARVAKLAWIRVVRADVLWNAGDSLKEEIEAASMRCTDLWNTTRAALARRRKQ